MKNQLQALGMRTDLNKTEIVAEIQKIVAGSYTVVETNDQKPWGAYLRLDNGDADRFVEQFFPGLSLDEARRGNPEAQLSPKFLIAAPGHRLSWQYHHRRVESWVFLTRGSFNKSLTDEQGEPTEAKPGTMVIFDRSERHRLNGDTEQWTIVAEIWQHTDSEHPSDEDDIVRVADDYAR